MAEFKKCPRNPELLLSDEWDEWRLATHAEVSEKTKRKIGTLNSSNIPRLFDGYVKETYNPVKQHVDNLKHMILVKTKVSRRSGGHFHKQMYEGVKLTPQGREAAVLLSCEDKITETICFVLDGIAGDDGEPQRELDKLTKSLEEKFRNGRTVLHYTVDQPHNKEHGMYVAKCLNDKFKDGKDLIKAADKYGRTALHFAALHGNTELCQFLVQKCEMEVDKKDQNEENLLHFAVRGETSQVFKDLCALPGVEKIINSQDAQGKTALHKAAAKGCRATIEALLSTVKRYADLSGLEEEKIRRCFIRQADLLGQTALGEATRGGHREVVQMLLDNGSSPLVERESDGRTALHYAVRLSDQEAERMARSLLDNCQTDKERSLLLWASATGSGTAEEASPESSKVKKYLKDQKEKLGSSDNLLKSAIELELNDMAWELVNRGANTDELRNCFKRNSDEEERDQNLASIETTVLKEIKNRQEAGRYQPTIDDGLGRKHFAEALALLFLNPNFKGRVTVAILGDRGMGKSSLMNLTEIIMLKTVAQLAFPNLLVKENFPGSKELKLSAEGRRKYKKIKKAVKDLTFEDLTDPDENPLVYFLDRYQQKYHDVYRALALMDRKEMFHVGKSDSSSNPYSLSNIPSILTVRYNAWLYQTEREAWAGLAVEIPKAIEESMTSAHRLRCRCRYAWEKHRNKMILEFFLPCFLAVVLSGLVVLVLWRLFSRSKDKELAQLKYGSIPITIAVAVWTVIRQVNSVFKPISAQIAGYFKVPDHSINLGYQHQVISDINFSKKEFKDKPSRLWRFLAWLWSFCGLRPDNVKGTSILKSPPSCEDDIRIIVFVHDLDRCQDTVILKVLSAVNLVLATCGINVIFGMDKKMIIRAAGKTFEDNKSDEDLAEKFLSKIVQLPLALPDINDHEIKEFVKQQVGQGLKARNAGLDDKTSKRRLETPLKMMMLGPNFSPIELNAVTWLSEVAVGSQRLPGEWERFLLYHRVARSIVYRSEQVRECAAWQVQLLVWIFCCWQWKDQINQIIENWENLVFVEEEKEQQRSLRNIVERYMEEKESEIIEKGERTKQKEKWEALKNTLIKYDVSMECIQAFQKLRLECKIKYLPPPPSDKNAKQSKMDTNISTDTQEDSSVEICIQSE